MTQHAMTINNQPGASFRGDNNNALQALATLSAGATAPAVTFGNQLWADTTASKLKKRNSANSAWVIIGDLDAIGFGLLSLAGGNMTGAVNDAITTVASAATPDIWTGTAGKINLTGTTGPITGFAAAPQAGASRTLLAASSPSLTAGANMLIDGVASGTNVTLSANDVVDVYAITTTQFRLTIKRYDGCAVVTSLRSTLRVVTANGYGSINTAIRRFTSIVNNQGSDITYADSATLGATFTINTNGVYAISFSDSYVGGSEAGVSLNSSQLTTTISNINATDRLVNADSSTANFLINAATTVYLTAGSVIRAHTNGSATGTPNISQFTITRVA